MVGKYKSEETKRLSKAKDYQKHKERYTIYKHQYYLEHKEQFKEWGRAWLATHREQAVAAAKAHRYEVKVEVLTHYGGGKLECVQCGFNGVRALSIDHINGGGNQHKRELGYNNQQFYRWLRREGFPTGFQTLCMNCQFMKMGEEK